jgi:DNA repair exonuclease SbcCD ATPase subunit
MNILIKSKKEMDLKELQEPPLEGMSVDELRSFARFLFGKLTTMTTTLEQLLASQKVSEEEQRKLMSQTESLQKQLQSITEKFSEACQQTLEVTRQKDKLEEELTIFKADHFGSSKTRKMKTKTEVAGRNEASPDKH